MSLPLTRYRQNRGRGNTIDQWKKLNILNSIDQKY